MSIKLTDLPEGTPTRVEVNGVPVCLVRTAAGVRAVHDTCSHQEASLAEGMVWGNEVECPLHGTSFDLDTGQPSSLPATTPVPTYAVTIDTGTAEVHVDTSTATNGADAPDH